MYFSVRTSLSIAGKVYTPCVCYKAPDALIPTIEKLTKEGKACIYDHRVSFQNGKILASVKEREAKAKAEKKAERQAKKVEKQLETEVETEGF